MHPRFQLKREWDSMSDGDEAPSTPPVAEAPASVPPPEAAAALQLPMPPNNNIFLVGNVNSNEVTDSVRVSVKADSDSAEQQGEGAVARTTTSHSLEQPLLLSTEDVDATATASDNIAAAQGQEEQDGDNNTWEVPLWASVETSYGGSVSTENILAWSKPHFKALTVFLSPIYKPSDPSAWLHLKQDLQAVAAKEGFSLVSKGAKGSTAADKTRHVLICARGRVVPACRRENVNAGTNAANNNNTTRPLSVSDCCRFRLTIHQDHNVDRYYIKGGQGNGSHRCHDRLEENAVLPKKRSRNGATQLSGNNNNVTWHSTSLTRTDRWKDHKGAVLWFTGLSGSGKSSIANQVECMLHQQRNVRTYLLDGDNLRHGLCSDLGFSPNDRLENMKRAAHVAKLMADAGLVVLCAFVSPHQLHREKVKTIVTENSDISFFEIHVKANLATCERRDPKGLYLKARAGILRNFTGISAPYEEPSNPDLVLDSDSNPVICLAEQVFNYLEIYLLSAKV